MLRDFCIIRDALEHPRFQQEPRRIISGMLHAAAIHQQALERLQEAGNIEAIADSGHSISYIPRAIGRNVAIDLSIGTLNYFENIADLVSFTADEPVFYHVHGIGDIHADQETSAPEIDAYRNMLRARKLLRATADFEQTGKATFLTPEKLEIPLSYTSAAIPPLLHLGELDSQLSIRQDQDSADREQRLVLFRKCLREFLKAHPPEQRFALFLRNFDTIYDSYSRDYQLWVGNTFGELEKSFEEKRLKFVADLNGILAGVQTSILAVPVATILLGDKYELTNPLKNFFLASAVVALGVVAQKLLENQGHTLDATRDAIDSTKTDFERKQTRRKAEFETRLTNLHNQEQRVRTLLTSMRNAIWCIMIFAVLAWLFSFVKPCLTPQTKPVGSEKSLPSVQEANPASTIKQIAPTTKSPPSFPSPKPVQTKPEPQKPIQPDKGK